MKLTSSALLALSISSLTAMANADEFMPTELKATSAQSETKGFLEDQTLGGTTRNWYANELKRRDDRFSYNNHGTRESTPRRINWVQGTILNYTSGFTEGTVGFSTQVAAYNAVALDRDAKDIAGPNNRTLTHSDGDAVGQWSKLGLANLSARISNTTLTVGRQNFSSPTIDVIGNRALPSSFQGVGLHSEEFNNLSFDAGSFDRVSPRTEASLSKFRSEYGATGAETDRASVAGLNYQPLKNLKTTLYATHVEDFWNQYYFGAVHDMGDNATLGLNTNFNYYKTLDTGSKALGNINNDTFSLAFGLSHLAHTLTLSYQQVSGDEYFDYLHETNGIYLANSLLSDFNGPNEKSLQLAYSINMAQYGIPGLKFNAYHARGWDIDGTKYTGTAYDVKNMDGETHYEYSVGTSYAIQSGPLKATAIRATYTTHRASKNQSDGNINEFRLVTTIPFNIL
ncbi:MULTISPECIES: OprD family porin [unclassified Pseudomonas]|uniref:OprD family porin n=1 Tax=unclassified Pseudomonas TaxID=196821 RepID=UPI001056BED7|nr:MULTISPECIES: OprD family porin [unclassified Pseudomonas]MBW3503050.1 OprD family porin [Pseudomonas sp. NKUCC02_KPG]MEC4169488.1 OprD family porin [Pseudomonas sp. MS-1(2024)]MEC4237940.1 OprD family porin [Pseudomonas sp. DSV-1]